MPLQPTQPHDFVILMKQLDKITDSLHDMRALLRRFKKDGEWDDIPANVHKDMFELADTTLAMFEEVVSQLEEVDYDLHAHDSSY